MTEVAHQTAQLTFTGFCNVMFGTFNEAFDVNKQRHYQLMSLPISSYYISSSRMCGIDASNPLTCSDVVQRYIDDLLAGCRCVEIECRDGDLGIPLVYGAPLRGLKSPLP
jgi:hypothetical protein